MVWELFSYYYIRSNTFRFSLAPLAYFDFKYLTWLPIYIVWKTNFPCWGHIFLDLGIHNIQRKHLTWVLGRHTQNVTQPSSSEYHLLKHHTTIKYRKHFSQTWKYTLAYIKKLPKSQYKEKVTARFSHRRLTNKFQ